MKSPSPICLTPASVERAIEGAYAVQMLCPVPHADADPAATMRCMIDVSADALRANPPQRVLALSDYGAEHASGTGITTLFHILETQLAPRRLAVDVSALQPGTACTTGRRVLPIALARGVLPSLHHPLSKLFPTVAAQDVGLLAAELLLDDRPAKVSPRVVSIEGEARASALDVARTLGELAHRQIVAYEAPRGEWAAMLQGAGLGENHARLVTDLYDAHNAGRIDASKRRSASRRFGADLARRRIRIDPRAVLQRQLRLKLQLQKQVQTQMRAKRHSYQEKWMHAYLLFAARVDRSSRGKSSGASHLRKRVETTRDHVTGPRFGTAISGNILRDWIGWRALRGIRSTLFPIATTILAYS